MVDNKKTSIHIGFFFLHAGEEIIVRAGTSGSGESLLVDEVRNGFSLVFRSSEDGQIAPGAYYDVIDYPKYKLKDFSRPLGAAFQFPKVGRAYLNIDASYQRAAYPAAWDFRVIAYRKSFHAKPSEDTQLFIWDFNKMKIAGKLRTMQDVTLVVEVS